MKMVSDGKLYRVSTLGSKKCKIPKNNNRNYNFVIRKNQKKKY